jgi:predicted DNA-binding transcriptional regulator AlpA
MSSAIPTSKRYLRKAQVCERYACSPTWIKRHIAADDFPEPAMHVGASPLWLVSDLDHWDAAQASKPRLPFRDMAVARAARQVRS